MNKPRFTQRFRKACLVVASQIHGRKGTWAYQAFEYINQTHFDNRLPWPHIVWGLTAHGSCTAWASTERNKTRPPVITLHPSLLRGAEKDSPWGIDRRWLGPSLVFDALLHECIHVHIDYNLGGHDGRSSHDCKRWVRQINRIAKELEFEDVRFGTTKSVRVPDLNAPRTPRGKVATVVVRRCDGNIPFAVGAGFPQSLRRYLNLADEHYSQNILPKQIPGLAGADY